MSVVESQVGRRPVGLAGLLGGFAGTGVDMDSESRTLLRVSAPIILSQLGAIGMNTMDTIMVGGLGSEALAAIGLSGSLHFALLVVTTGTLFGMGPLVSQAFGARNPKACADVLVQGILLALVLSIPMVFVNARGEQLALALGQDPGIAELVGQYMAALSWGVPPLLVLFACRQYLEGMGITKPAMVITFLGLGVNFVGNSMLIYGAGGIFEPMGAVGSGWATTIVRWAMLGAMLLWLRRLGVLSRTVLLIRWNPELLRRIAYIGFPTGLQVGLEVGFFAFAAVMMGWFGPTELGTHQVTINIAATTFMFAMGFSLAGSMRVGHHIGARNPDGARANVMLTYLFATVSMLLFAALFLTVPERLLGLYTTDPSVIKLGASLMLMAALFQVFDGAQVAGFSVLRGAADTRVPMLMAAGAYWGIGAPSGYFLAFHTSLGPVGVWAGLVIGLAAAMVLLAYRVWIVHWKQAPAPVLGIAPEQAIA
jgi:multidrug resistance protein, MATE family